MHQHLQEHLIGPYRKISCKVKIRKGIFTGAGVLLLGAVLLVWSLFIRPDPYDEKLTVNYFTGVIDCVAQTGSEIELLTLLAESDGQGAEYTSALQSLETYLSRHGEIIEHGYGGSYKMAVKLYESLSETGEVVPWSMEKIDESGIEMLFSLNEEIYESYGTYAEILTFLYENETLNEKYGEQYRKALSQKLEADAALSDALYSSVLSPHLEGLKSKDPKTYSYYIDTLSGYTDLSNTDNKNPDGAEVAGLRKASDEKKSALESLEIFTIYRREKTK